MLFAANSDLLFSASNDNSVRVWNLQTGETIHHLTGHEKGISSIALSPDEAYLLSGSYDGTIKLWDWINDECIATFEDQRSEVNAVAFHPEGNLFVGGYADQIIRVWEMKPELFVEHYYSQLFESELSQSLLFQPKGKEETKSDYKIRQEKALSFRNATVQKYYNQYLKEIKGKVKPKR